MGPHALPYGITPGDTADKIISKIASGLGVPNGDPSVMQTYTDLVVAEHQREEADKDAQRQQSFNDGMKYGTLHKGEVVGDGDLTIQRFNEAVPGKSGNVCDVTVRVGNIVVQKDLFSTTTTVHARYYAPHDIVPSASIEYTVEPGAKPGTYVEKITKVDDPTGVTGFKVGDTRTTSSSVVAPAQSAAGAAPSTPDPPNGDAGLGTTSHTSEIGKGDQGGPSAVEHPASTTSSGDSSTPGHTVTPSPGGDPAPGGSATSSSSTSGASPAAAPSSPSSSSSTDASHPGSSPSPGPTTDNSATSSNSSQSSAEPQEPLTQGVGSCNWGVHSYHYGTSTNGQFVDDGVHFSCTPDNTTVEVVLPLDTVEDVYGPSNAATTETTNETTEIQETEKQTGDGTERTSENEEETNKGGDNSNNGTSNNGDNHGDGDGKEGDGNGEPKEGDGAGTPGATDGMPNPEGTGPGSPSSTPNPEGDDGDGTEGHRGGATIGHGHVRGGGGGDGGGDGASEGPDGSGTFTGKLAAGGDQQGAAGPPGSHLPRDPGEEMPNPEDTGIGGPSSHIAHGVHSFWDQAAGATHGESIAHLSTSAVTESTAPLHIAFDAPAMTGAHDAVAGQSDTSTHSVTTTHDVSTHDVGVAHADVHAELGTATLHEALTLHGASFATQMHV
jgi:hypothetical protein